DVHLIVPSPTLGFDSMYRVIVTDPSGPGAAITDAGELEDINDNTKGPNSPYYHISMGAVSGAPLSYKGIYGAGAASFCQGYYMKGDPICSGGTCFGQFRVDISAKY
ncbi:MAG: hypothetical protein KDD53_08875, partial [Bdellovibrionales bacterium]|nr:hypothetical protein [Bdellovibrionales bacterium]